MGLIMMVICVCAPVLSCRHVRLFVFQSHNMISPLSPASHTIPHNPPDKPDIVMVCWSIILSRDKITSELVRSSSLRSSKFD